MYNYLVFAVIIMILIIIWFGLLKKKKINNNNRKHLKRYMPILEQEVEFYRNLSPMEKDRFAKGLVSFLGRVTIEGIGTEVEDLDRALVASSAIIPIFSFSGWRYPNLTNVILYPDMFNEQFEYAGSKRNTLGMVGSGFMNGQMILSKKSLRQGFKNTKDGRNTGIHEFVHLIDKSDGSTDGIPEGLLQKPYIIPWIQVMQIEIQRIAKGKSDIDSYALTNEAEFFAVVAEYFFENPERLKTKHPKLYDLLSTIFSEKGKF